MFIRALSVLVWAVGRFVCFLVVFSVLDVMDWLAGLAWRGSEGERQ